MEFFLHIQDVDQYRHHFFQHVFERLAVLQYIRSFSYLLRGTYAVGERIWHLVLLWHAIAFAHFLLDITHVVQMLNFALPLECLHLCLEATSFFVSIMHRIYDWLPVYSYVDRRP